MKYVAPAKTGPDPMDLVRHPISHLYRYQLEEMDELAAKHGKPRAVILRDLLAYALENKDLVFLELSPAEAQAILKMRRR